MRTLSGIVLLLVAGFLPAAEFPEARHGKGELKHVQGMPVVTVRGTPAEIGEQFGILAVKNAPDIDALQNNFFKEAKLERGAGFAKLMATRLKPGFPPDHLTEIETAAKFSGRELGLALFANSVYDLSSGMGCSTIIVEKKRSQTGSPIFGRNFDWLPSKGITDHTLLAVFHPAGKKSFAIVTVTPIVGCISGMNEAGLSITLNEIRLKQSNDKSEFNWEGTPIMLAYRRVLEECSTVKEAEALLKSMKRTTAACMTICDREGGAVFEITPKSVEMRAAKNEVCLCTNHFRTNPLALSQECWRYSALEVLEKNSRPMGVVDVFAQLHRVTQEKFTLQSMVFEPADKKLHLKYSQGFATKADEKIFDMGKLLAEK